MKSSNYKEKSDDKTNFDCALDDAWRDMSFDENYDRVSGLTEEE